MKEAIIKYTQEVKKEYEFKVPQYFVRTFEDGSEHYGKILDVQNGDIEILSLYKVGDVILEIKISDIRFFSDDHESKRRFAESTKPLTREEFQDIYKQITQEIYNKI